MIHLESTFGFLAIQTDQEINTKAILAGITEFCSRLPRASIQQINLPHLTIFYWTRDNNELSIKDQDQYSKNSNNSIQSLLIGNIYESSLPTENDSPDSWCGLNGRYAWLQWQQQNKTLHATTDFLGIRPLYYLQSNNALVISSEIYPLTKSPFFDHAISPTGYVQMLEKGYCLGDNTLYNSIKWLQPGSLLTYKKGKLEISNQQQLPINFSESKENNHEKLADHLFELLLSSTEKRAKNQEHSILLSGGIDSRVVGGLLHKLNLLSGTITWHQDNGGDFLAAKEIAKTLQVPASFINIPFDHLQKYHEDLIIIDGSLTNAHITYLIAALNNIEQPLPALAIGYSGDPLTGAHFPLTTHLGNRHPSVDESADHFNQSLGRFFKDDELNLLLRKPEWKDEIGSSRKEFKKTMSSVQTDEHFRRWMTAFLWSRNQRYTTFLPRICDNFTPTFSPFEDKEIYDFCLSLPLDALTNQAIYRKMLSRHFPELAQIPRSNGEQISPDIALKAQYRYQAKITSLLPKALQGRLNKWGGGGYAIDPSADLRRGSADYLHALLKKDDIWGEYLDKKQVSELILNHLTNKTKQGLQIQALVTTLESLIFNFQKQ